MPLLTPLRTALSMIAYRIKALMSAPLRPTIRPTIAPLGRRLTHIYDGSGYIDRCTRSTRYSSPGRRGFGRVHSFNDPRRGYSRSESGKLAACTVAGDRKLASEPTGERSQVRQGKRVVLAVLSGGCAVLAACSSSGGPPGSVAPSAAASPTGHTPASRASPATSKTMGIVRFQLPPAGHGCTGARSVDRGGATIPVTVSSRQGQVAAMANVCINDKGPFPFLIDTGAASSVVTASLARTVGLRAVGQPLELGGVACTAQAHNSRITKWNVAGLALKPADVTYLDIPLFGQKGEPDGVLGSDLWSRFGAMRLDFARGLITVPGPEQAAPTKESVIMRPSSQPVPSALLRGGPRIIAPMRVDSRPDETIITVPVALGTSAPAAFTPDTGASQSAVDSGLAVRDGLTRLRTFLRQGTACTVATFPEVDSGTWSIAGHQLTPQPLGSAELEQTVGVAGLLGADQMSRYGSVIFDYAGGRLILGAG